MGKTDMLQEKKTAELFLSRRQFLQADFSYSGTE